MPPRTTGLLNDAAPIIIKDVLGSWKMFMTIESKGTSLSYNALQLFLLRKFEPIRGVVHYYNRYICLRRFC